MVKIFIKLVKISRIGQKTFKMAVFIQKSTFYQNLATLGGAGKAFFVKAACSRGQGSNPATGETI